MRALIAVAAVCFAFALTIAPAHAREVSSVQPGPIITIEVPDGWSTYLDAARNVHARSPDGGVNLEGARSAGQTFTRVGDEQIAGIDGVNWRATAQASDGTMVNLDTRVVRLNAGFIGVIMVGSTAATTPSALDVANRIVQSARIE